MSAKPIRNADKVAVRPRDGRVWYGFSDPAVDLRLVAPVGVVLDFLPKSAPVGTTYSWCLPRPFLFTLNDAERSDVASFVLLSALLAGGARKHRHIQHMPYHDGVSVHRKPPTLRKNMKEDKEKVENASTSLWTLRTNRMPIHAS